MAQHFHEEWSFRFTWLYNGKVKKTCRVTEYGEKTLLSEAEARQVMDEMKENASAYIKMRGKDGDFDAYEVYAPVKRIVTEWEDETPNEEVRK